MTALFTNEYAAARDAADPLRGFRDEFHLPLHDGKPQAYFVGNSLGLQPKGARAHVEEVLDKWATQAVEGHFTGQAQWMTYHELVRDPLARVVGAQPFEVVAMNSLTANLHLMLASFYRPTRERPVLLMEAGAFPSDRYALESQVRFHGFDPAEALVEVEPDEADGTFSMAAIERAIAEHGPRLAAIVWPGVQYRTGQAFDLKEIARLAHAAGAIVGFDLAHAVGNLPLQLHDSGADFAVWCHYKYMNSGPGAVAGCFVHERHARTERPRFAGWWGNNKDVRFRMGPEFDPTPGADGWQLSNPPILGLAPLRASLEQFERATMTSLRAKSEALTGHLERLIDADLRDVLQIVTPGDPSRRGCQLSLRVIGGRERGRDLFDFLAIRGVLGDWREPDVIRISPVPLYNTHADVLRFATTVREWRDGNKTVHADRREMTIVGGGLAGALLAILLAQRGWSVDVYERRGDPRVHGYAGGRSINLALAERGLHALRRAGADRAVMEQAVMMRGRFVHPLRGEPGLQRYGRDDSEVIWSINRGELNIVLLDIAESHGARLHFDHALKQVDFVDKVAVFKGDGHETRKPFHALVGADGAGSSLRGEISKVLPLGERTEWLDHGYKELEIPPASDGDFRIEPNALHIWPRGHYMCIALPNDERTFTVTLFMPHAGAHPSFETVRTADEAQTLFEHDFPDTLPLIPDLRQDYEANPVGTLGTLYLDRWHLEGRAVLIGDAAHAMVPFHGQGMNCAFEDCVALADHLDNSPSLAGAFAAFEAQRKPDAQAIQQMALENYIEMRDKVDDSGYLLQRQLELALQDRHPGRFVPHYAMVSFMRIRYSVALHRSEVQRAILEDATRDIDSLDDVNWETLDAAVLEQLDPIA